MNKVPMITKLGKQCKNDSECSFHHGTYHYSWCYTSSNDLSCDVASKCIFGVIIKHVDTDIHNKLLSWFFFFFYNLIDNFDTLKLLDKN